MKKHSFRQWLARRIQNEAEIPPPPGDDWNLIWSTYKKPPQWVWIKAGQKLVPAFTNDDPKLFNPKANHSSAKAKPQQSTSQIQKSVPTNQTTQNQATQNQMSNATQPQSRCYYLAVSKKLSNMESGVPLVAYAVPTGWAYSDRTRKITGIIPTKQVSDAIESVKDSNKVQISSHDPNYLFATYDEMKRVEQQKLAQQKKPKAAKSCMLSDDMMSEEQKAIDAKFAQLMSSPNQSHIMINALAGSGKTTMLCHLAHKYGQGQKWLYIVFNTKNKVEGMQKFPKGVEVKTTNGFLGDVLQDKSNSNRIPQTERMIQAINNLDKSSEEESGKRKEKIRLVADSADFTKLLSSLRIPEKIAESDGGKVTKTVNSLLRSIQYTFKEQVLLLTNLAKAYAIDPRQSDLLDEALNKIVQSYDFDTDFEKVKKRITSYSGSFRIATEAVLKDIFGQDFMQKDFTNEIKFASKWMLNATMPLGTKQTHQHKRYTLNLGEIRDFNDDLWFAAIHADNIAWPKYDVVLADEVQDFNEAQKIMLKKLGEAGAKIVAVGDPNQGIYRFRGADSSAFDNLGTMLGDSSHDKNHMFTLSKNFRSRKKIIDFANEKTHVKNLQQGKKFDDDGEGAVTQFEIKYDGIFDALQNEKNENGQIKQTAFIARTNEPLVHTALSLLTKKIPFLIIGKDIAGDLRKHIEKILRLKGIPDDEAVEVLQQELQDYLEREQELYFGSATQKNYLQETTEVTTAILSCIDQVISENPNRQIQIANFKDWIRNRLGGLDLEASEKDIAKYQNKIENENPIILTTAHKSKGLEFERVFILRYDQFPHKKAKRKEDLDQEENAKYVALTRAMDELHILDLNGQPGYKK
jgi:Superfamily I DNA and RNA helicases